MRTTAETMDNRTSNTRRVRQHMVRRVSTISMKHLKERGAREKLEDRTYQTVPQLFIGKLMSIERSSNSETDNFVLSLRGKSEC